MPESLTVNFEFGMSCNGGGFMAEPPMGVIGVTSSINPTPLSRPIRFREHLTGDFNGLGVTQPSALRSPLPKEHAIDRD